MGSFNLTCLASRQTIAPRDRCVVIPVIEQQGHHIAKPAQQSEVPRVLQGSFESPNGPARYWRPLGTALEATYADYASFELAGVGQNGVSLLGFVQHVYERSIAVLAGDNPYHEPSFDLPAYLEQEAPELNELLKSKTPPTLAEAVLYAQCVRAFEYIAEGMRSHRVFLTNAFGVPLPAYLAVIHKSAYDYLCEAGQEGNQWDGVSLKAASFSKHCVEKALKRYAEQEPHNPVQMPDKVSNMLRLHFAATEVGDSLNSIAMPLLGRQLNESMAIQSLLERTIAGTLTQEEMAKGLLPWMTWRYVCRGLDELNISLEPLAYCDQDYSNAIGESYARFVTVVSRQVSASRSV